MRLIHLDKHAALLPLLAAVPAWLLAAALFWQSPWTIYPKLLWLFVAAMVPLAAALALHRHTVWQLRSIASLLEAIRIGDYTVRMRLHGNAVMDELAAELNVFADSLHRQRLQSESALRLVDSVVAGIDVAIFAIDEAGLLTLANPAACRLLQRDAASLVGQPAREAGLAALLDADPEQVCERVFPGGAGLWQVRRQDYRVVGRVHTLLFVSDLKQVLRSEELKAWRQLIRVISHEVNNSLGPIASVGGTLRKLLARETRDGDARDDLDGGLAIIEERAIRLGEFIRRYAALARLPEPEKQVFDLAVLLRRLPGLTPACAVELLGPADASLPFFGDPGQIEPLLINLLTNAVEAGASRIALRWQGVPLHIAVVDNGRGVANPTNLFVPFYTTKPSGSGIGLVLCRQIAEAHHGSLTIQNNADGVGCTALLQFAAAGQLRA
jgi:nitrogen fixation/metabolism regulation signal transduction histidine kinase